MKLDQILKPARRIVSAGLIATTLALPFAGCGACQARTSAEESTLDSLQYIQSCQTLWALDHGAHLWGNSDLELVKHKGRRNVKFRESTFLPNFYIGEFPFKYTELSTAGLEKNRVLNYQFDETSDLFSRFPRRGFTELFVYDNLGFAGAVALDDSLRVVAELRRYNDPTGRFFSDCSQDIIRGYHSSPEDAVLMEEVHYNLSGVGPDRIGYYCVSQFDRRNGEKRYEFDLTIEGEKLRDFFFMTPPMR